MNIKEITITILNVTGTTHLIINPNSNIINVNGYDKSINQEHIYDLLRIIREWSKKYYKSGIIDAEKYKVEIIESNGNIDTYEGEGSYPINYSIFKSWIGGYLND